MPGYIQYSNSFVRSKVARILLLSFPAVLWLIACTCKAVSLLPAKFGDLNATRDTILVNNREFDTKIKREDLGQFVDEQGRKLTEVFGIR